MPATKRLLRGLGAAGLPFVAAIFLVPFRHQLDNASAALVLAIVVAVVATFMGRWPTVVAVVVAALSFDVLHTEPFGSFTIHGADDVVKTVLLLVVGLGAASLAAQRTEAVAALEERRTYLGRVRDVTRAAERSPEALVERLELDLTELLGLESATYRPGEAEPMPRITPMGIAIPPGTPALDPERRDTWVLELPVCLVDRQLGRFELHPRRPTSGVDLPPGRRDLALTWADQLAFALARPATADGSRG